MSTTYPKKYVGTYPKSWVTYLKNSWDTEIESSNTAVTAGVSFGMQLGIVEHTPEILYVWSDDFSSVRLVIGFYDDGAYAYRTSLFVDFYKNSTDRESGATDFLHYEIDIPRETEKVRFTIMTEPLSVYKKEQFYGFGRLWSLIKGQDATFGVLHDFEIEQVSRADSFQALPDIVSPRLYDYESKESNVHQLLRAVVKPFDYLVEKLRNFSIPGEHSGALQSLGWFWFAEDLTDAERLRLALKIAKLSQLRVIDNRFTASKDYVNAVMEVIAGIYNNFKRFEPLRLSGSLVDNTRIYPVLDDDSTRIYPKRDELTYLFVVNVYNSIVKPETVYKYLKKFLPVEIAPVIHSVYEKTDH